jgi:GTP-binding protein
LNKVDAIDETELAVKAHELELAIGAPVLQMSGVARTGLTEVLREVAACVETRDAAEKAAEQSEADGGTGWRP